MLRLLRKTVSVAIKNGNWQKNDLQRRVAGSPETQLRSPSRQFVATDWPSSALAATAPERRPSFDRADRPPDWAIDGSASWKTKRSLAETKSWRKTDLEEEVWGRADYFFHTSRWISGRSCVQDWSWSAACPGRWGHFSTVPCVAWLPRTKQVSTPFC